MTDNPARRLVDELLRTIHESETEDDEDILNAVCNLLVTLAKAAKVPPHALLRNVGLTYGARSVDVEVMRVPKGQS